MKVVYKYELGPVTSLVLPIGTRVLTVQMQGDRLVLYALLDQQQQEAEYRSFMAVNTGISFDAPAHHYIGTATTSNGIVWHVFEHANGATS